MMANFDPGLSTHIHTVLSLGSELSFGTPSVLRSFRKYRFNNMLLLMLEAKNNYVEAPILLQKK